MTSCQMIKRMQLFFLFHQLLVQHSLPGHENESDDENTGTTSGQDETAYDITGRKRTICAFPNPALTVKIPLHNNITVTPKVSRCLLFSISLPYSAWKRFVRKSILRSVAKFTIKGTKRRGDVDFSLSLDQLKSFIALQYAKGKDGKHQVVALLWNNSYRNHIFHEILPQNKLTKVLKYLRFDGNPSRMNKHTKMLLVVQNFDIALKKAVLAISFS